LQPLCGSVVGRGISLQHSNPASLCCSLYCGGAPLAAFAHRTASFPILPIARLNCPTIAIIRWSILRAACSLFFNSSKKVLIEFA